MPLPLPLAATPRPLPRPAAAAGSADPLASGWPVAEGPLGPFCLLWSILARRRLSATLRLMGERAQPSQQKTTTNLLLENRSVLCVDKALAGPCVGPAPGPYRGPPWRRFSISPVLQAKGGNV